MLRYLSPAKICLVILIELYRTNEVKSTDSITLLSFVSTHTLRRSSDGFLADEPIQPDSIRTLADFQSLLSALTSSFPGRSLYDVFLRKLWNVQSLESLEHLFNSSTSPDLDQSLARQPVSPHSPVGQFLRRCNLEYVRLQFHDAQHLWEDFLLFREPSRNAWAARNPDRGSAAVELGAVAVNLPPELQFSPSPILVDRLHRRHAHNGAALPSQDELENMIQFQLEHLQSSGCRVPPELAKQLRSMIEHSAVISPDLHFIRFFDSWRSGAYTDAIDHLHRYFDYAMEGYGMHQNVKSYHQYALLHLAVLHADFGRFEEAVDAMSECISTARENQDGRCLNFGLSWLVHLRKSHPDYARYEELSQAASVAGEEKDILAFLQQKALESKEYLQLSSSLLAQAGSEMAKGGSLGKAIELSYQSGYLNSKYALRGIEPTQVRLHGSLFARAGASAYAGQQHTLYEHIYGSHASQTEVLSLGSAEAYQHALMGRYQLAMTQLMKHDPSINKTPRMNNIYVGFANMIRLKKALHRNESFAAESLMRQLKPVYEFAEPDVVFECKLLEIDYLQRRQELDEAYHKVQLLIDEDKSGSQSDQCRRIKLLNMKAALWCRAGKPAKGFSVALRAASSAYNRLLLPLLWEAIVSLSCILIDVGEFEGANRMLDSIMPHAVEGADRYLVARLYALLADSLVGLAGEAYAQGRKGKDSLLSTALGYLERAKDAFDQVEDVEGSLLCLEKKATIFRHRQEDSLAAEVDMMYDAVANAALIRDNEARGVDSARS